MKHTPLSLFATLLLALSYNYSTAHAGEDHGSGPRADGHAPIGVMKDHRHVQGEWMFSYRYMNMHMDGMLSGNDDISPGEVAGRANPLAGEKMRMGNLPDGSPRIMKVPPLYRISPLEMDMEMHMFGAMYGLNNEVTLMAMIPYIEKEMTLRTFAGREGTKSIGEFTGDTSGIGDIKLSALIKLSEENNKNIHFDVGLSLPTGSITEKARVLPPFAGRMIPAGETVDIDRAAYPMQLGSGSYDLLTGVTYYGRHDDLSWGSQLATVIRLNDNDEDYKLGNRFEISAWLAKQWLPWVSGSARIKAFSEGEIDGRDDVITGGMPLFVASNSGRDEVDLSFGLNFLGVNDTLPGHRFAIEAGAPIYQDVNGLQMKNDWSITIGWQKAF